VIKAIQGILLDDLSQQRSMQLMRYVIVWLLRLVAPDSQYPRKQLTLPLPEEQPLVFRCLPEYFLEDIVDNFKFITRNMPHIILSSQCDELVTIAVTFLRSSDYVKNPFLKSGLVSILYHGSWPIRGRQKGLLGDILNSSPFCVKHLLHALMMFYIEAETTGGHNQFYDKFNIRFEIFHIIRSIWTNPVYRENLNTEARVNVDFFVRFVNLLINDVTYILDESFTAFGKIHTLQEELENPNHGLDETQKQEKEQQLEEQKGRAKANMQFTNETVSMLKLFTEVMAEAFTMPEVVQRLADMLDYNLESMVGPKQRNLKVRDPQSYEFAPSVLLSDIMAVYINLKDQPSFCLAVARDGRSYKPYNLEHAAEIMAKTSLKSPEELKVWRKFAAAVEATREADQQAEDDLGEIPDELLDPLMCTLMEDPVILPNSRVTIDRSTIRSHLLSDPHDPFNRMPLKIEDVVPDEEMKARIERFRADARQRKLDAIQAAQRVSLTDEDAMDTS
jgi:ubiquitin conjugation factor E4 B